MVITDADVETIKQKITIKMANPGPVLINGAGTVGLRVADMMLSVGISIVLGKYHADPNYADEKGDVKTRELMALKGRYPQVPIKILVARGSNLDERVKGFQDLGFDAEPITPRHMSDFSLAIDASNGREGRNIPELYRFDGTTVPFVLNGGANPALVDRLFFASVPGTTTYSDQNRFRTNNAMITSCNTHAVSTALALVSQAFGTEYFQEAVRDISITFCRRHEDPHKGEAKPEHISMKVKRYHLDEIEFLLPQTKDLVNSTVSKWPVEYFHTLVIDLDFHVPLSDRRLDRVVGSFTDYKRCILTEGGVDHQMTIDAAEKAKIPDGDIPFPVYSVDQVSRYKMRIMVLTPQRGIVAPSTLDYVLFRTGCAETIQDAFDFTNVQARYRGEPMYHHKNALEDNLREAQSEKSK